MKTLFAIWITLMSISAVQAQETSFEKFGMYVVVSDLPRAAAFYEKVFQKAPYVSNDRFVGFDVAGGLYALFLTSASDIPRQRGNNAVPYLRVKNADTEFTRIKSLTPTIDTKVIQEGPLKLFRFSDLDGNVVEFFSVTLPN
jgi:predicted enzyme related to lactoylglutathione lyase